MILPTQTIRKLAIELGMIEPFIERGVFLGMTYGLGPATYDVRIRQTLIIPGHGFVLGSTIERVNMPNDVRATMCDKSSWARRGIAIQNTKIDPGFCGHITVEITNHTEMPITIDAGMPIAQMEFARLEEPTEMPYRGKYQNQPDEVVAYKPAKGIWE